MGGFELAGFETAGFELAGFEKSAHPKLHASMEVTNDAFQNNLGSKEIDGNPMQEQRIEKQMEINKERSREDDYSPNTNGRVKSLLTENAIFFVTVGILNFTMAVLITTFCFIFPNAFKNIKLSIGKAWDWLKLKLDSGVTLGLELPNLGIRAVKVAASPFTWMWRFLGCVGKCFGVSMPRITMPRWVNCILECFKKDWTRLQSILNMK